MHRGEAPAGTITRGFHFGTVSMKQEMISCAPLTRAVAAFQHAARGAARFFRQEASPQRPTNISPLLAASSPAMRRRCSHYSQALPRGWGVARLGACDCAAGSCEGRHDQALAALFADMQQTKTPLGVVGATPRGGSLFAKAVGMVRRT